ncbi:MAG TPA: ferrochelatase [Candidatus Eisenbacteria bacterium]|nr:ferrochelatase [Candidatus Eisenbacteria bacterium]
MPADAVLLLAFGGPTAPDEIRPFLENVTRGRRIPAERLDAVAHHYELIGGRSPMNELTFRQADGLRRALGSLPVYVGMRNWAPYIADVVAEMTRNGVRRAVGLVLSPHANEASRERYVEAVAEARARAGARAPEVAWVSTWHVHPRFIEAVAACVATARSTLPADRRTAAAVVFTAHSVPVATAAVSPYEREIAETATAVAAALGVSDWQVAYQSRSGNPRDPWLEPDVNDVLRALRARGARDVVVAPIGFVCDHVEVLYDLDVEARQTACDVGLGFVRASAVNDHPAFVAMLADVVRSAGG